MTTATTRQLWCKEDALNIEQCRTQNYFSLVVLNCKIMLPRWIQSLVETQWLSEFPSRRQQVFPPVECWGASLLLYWFAHSMVCLQIIAFEFVDS